ncbi:type II toxin-antitoxin system RelE/ParE family toxin [Flavobacterium sp. RHBU_3]|uniref:type II toxin-antitoxin system RelE/ParE family toxin n=1 Tax=Flavobacterium sp. RHBU_3 TaxID=3391184 RepID=UPI0039856074
MDYKILWSDYAVFELNKIFNYYLEKAGFGVAVKIYTTIVSEADRLLIDPETYPFEDALLDREIQYRYIICDSYKIIYSINKPLKEIKIADVFDTRQNPFKLKRTK